MIGRFLELGLPTDNILDSIGFYEELGFKQLNTGDIWQHPYAVLSDGVINIGLHAIELPAPMMTFVLPDLANDLVEFRSRGIEFEVEKTGNHQFNELVFIDAEETCCIRVIEARTFSPAPFDQTESTLGRFHEITLPVIDVTAASAFWQRLGLTELEQTEEPYPQARLQGDGIVLGLHCTPAIREPALSFRSENMSRQLAKMEQIGIRMGGAKAPLGVKTLRSPENLAIFMQGARS